MRRLLAPAPLASALTILLSGLLSGGCAAGPKFNALPPPADSGEPAAAADAPPRWSQPFATDDAGPMHGKGMGVLYAQYPFMDKAKDVQLDTETSTKVTRTIEPLKANLFALYLNKEVGFYGLGYGDLDVKIHAPGAAPNSGLTFRSKVIGLYEGVRVPIRLVDFKKADVQVFLIPGLTLQVLVTLPVEDTHLVPPALHWKLNPSMIAGGSLNGAGLGISFGGRFMIEADFFKVGWTYFLMDWEATNSTATTKPTRMASFSAWSYGFAPVVFARAMW
jgi:hypothetical protein